MQWTHAQNNARNEQVIDTVPPILKVSKKLKIVTEDVLPSLGEIIEYVDNRPRSVYSATERLQNEFGEIMSDAEYTEDEFAS